MVGLVDQLFIHLLKAINICSHVIDDVPPGPVVKVRFRVYILQILLLLNLLDFIEFDDHYWISLQD